MITVLMSSYDPHFIICAVFFLIFHFLCYSFGILTLLSFRTIIQQNIINIYPLFFTMDLFIINRCINKSNCFILPIFNIQNNKVYTLKVVSVDGSCPLLILPLLAQFSFFQRDATRQKYHLLIYHQLARGE